MNILFWSPSWSSSTGKITWSARWKDSGVFNLAQSSPIALTGALHFNNASFGYTLAVPFNLVQASQKIGLTGVVGFTPTVLGYTLRLPYYLEQRPQIDLLGVVGVGGNLSYTLPGTIKFNVQQVGAFTVRGVVSASGNVGYTLATPSPFDVVQTSQKLAIAGVVKTVGNIQIRRSFALLTQPLALQGTLQISGALKYPRTFYLVQQGYMEIFGVVGAAAEFKYRQWTEGLPTGWYIEHFLEDVPNPNFGTIYGNIFFRRHTWKGFDDQGQMVAASGSEDDCYAQTLSVCQSRFANWRSLA